MTATSESLTQDDVLLLIAEGATGSYDLDPIRIMKGAFLVSQLGTEPWRKLFNFKPYRYGPFDPAVYDARTRLIRAGLLTSLAAGRYPSYELTDEGRDRVEDLRKQLGEDVVSWFGQVGRYVTTRPFAKLLEEIYERYPPFAVRSVMR